jgi:hypothetical protein
MTKSASLILFQGFAFALTGRFDLLFSGADFDGRQVVYQR